MTHTVDTLMTLADRYRDLKVGEGTAQSRAALRAALTEALAQPVREPAQLEQSEREAFEAYALKTVCTNEDLQQRRLTGYGSQELNYLWRGWSARASLQYAQPVREPLSEERIIELGHRMATKYTHRSDPTSHAYGFVKHTLVDFVRAIERENGIGGDK